MNELEFKRHLRDLAHGHHHPEEHDWDAQSGSAGKALHPKSAGKNRRAAAKTSKRK